jgi:hypothetical protein
MTRNTGGPAFPQPEPIFNEFHPNYGKDRGMTLRDYFAAKAMHALMVKKQSQTPAFICQEAYHMADVMLRAREI